MVTRLALVVAGILCASPALAQQKPDWITDLTSGCKVWNRQPQPKESISWSGDCRAGLASGRGVLQWFESGKPTERYEGEMENGKLNGWGKCFYFTGARYKGYLSNHERSGRGRYYFANGARYEGEYRHDRPNGLGRYTSPEGVVFEGTWADGCFKQDDRWATANATSRHCGFGFSIE